MKVLYSLCCFVCAMLYNNAAQAYFSPYHTGTPPIEKTETKPNAEPKLSSAGYIKYAAVEFIAKTGKITQDSNNIDLSKPIKEADCPTGEILVNGVCMSKTSCQNNYPLTSVSANVGRYISSDCGSGMRYCYISCNSGWTQNGCYCKENSCDGYPLSTSTLCSESYACKKGESYMYKCTACPDGYGLENGICIETRRPDNCPYDSKPSDSKGAIASKTYGHNICYYYTSCYEGYSGPAGGDCTAKSCDRTVYPYNVLSGLSSSAGVLISCKSGENTYWGYTRCNEGWTLSGAKCLENSCTGYDSATATIAHCNNLASCQKGSTKLYKCTSCQSGYRLNSSGLCEGIVCAIGDYYYSDDSCSSVLDASKTQIGVVLDNEKKLVISKEAERMTWAKQLPSKDIPDLSYYGGSNAAPENDTNGINNTQKIVDFAASSGIEHPAAQYCYNMTTANKKWWLPAAGELLTLRGADNYSKIHNSLQISGLFSVVSSTQYNRSYYYDGSNSSSYYTRQKNTGNNIRCVFAYGEADGPTEACPYTAHSKPENCEETKSCERNSNVYYDTVCTKCTSFGAFELVNGACVPTTAPSDYNYNLYTGCADLCTNKDTFASGYQTFAKCNQCASGTMLHTYIDLDGKTATECIRKSDAYYVGGKAVGVIVDPNNHLVLSLKQKEVATQQGNNPYNEASAYCSAMTDGWLSWRLPSGEEFKSMLRLEDEDPNCWECEEGKNLRAIAMKLKEISGAHKLTGNESTTGQYVSSDGKGYEFTDNYPRSGFAYDTHQTSLYTGGLPSERGGFSEGHYYARCVANY